MAKRRQEDESGTPALEWAASLLGAAFALGIVGFVLWDGLANADAPPDIRVELGRRHALAGGFAIEFEAVNEGGRPAADVLLSAGEGEEKSEVTFDFIPAQSRRKGTFVFTAEPTAALTIRVLGYRDP